MILEIDCGNSLIKWRVIDAGTSKSVALGAAATDAEVLGQLRATELPEIRNVRLASVRADSETTHLVDGLEELLSLTPKIAKSQRTLGGVENGYADYTLLGVDRWLAIVAAFGVKGDACLVIDIGTAVTADYITARGQHLGGFICPGIMLMRKQLSEHTARISYVPSAREVCSEPGRTTAEAVEFGCRLMLEGFIQKQFQVARCHFGAEFSIILTGGDAGLVESLLPGAQVIPDLVFRGLAIACPV